MAFTRFYEPASVIKLVTLAAALRRGTLDRLGLFPFTCPGSTVIDGRIFHDWWRHDRVPHVEEAMAVSCNLAFARVGMAVGREGLLEELRRFGFGGRLEGTLLPMELGRVEADPASDYALASLAVGLGSLKATPLHLALIAAAVANRGEMMAPRLLLRRENLLGAPILEVGPRSLGRTIEESSTAQALTDAMFEAAEREGDRPAGGGGGAGPGGEDGNRRGEGPGPRRDHDRLRPGPPAADRFRRGRRGGKGKAELAAAAVTRSLLQAVLQRLILAPPPGRNGD